MACGRATNEGSFSVQCRGTGHIAAPALIALSAEIESRRAVWDGAVRHCFGFGFGLSTVD